MLSTLSAAAFLEAFQTLSQHLGVFIYCACRTLSVPTRFKKRVQQVCKAKKYASGYRESQSGFLWSLQTKRPQASRTWQARLESAFNKMMVRKGGEWTGRKKCHDHGGSSWEKLKSISLQHIGKGSWFYFNTALKQLTLAPKSSCHKMCHIFCPSARMDVTYWGFSNYFSTPHLCSVYQHGRSATV